MTNRSACFLDIGIEILTHCVRSAAIGLTVSHVALQTTNQYCQSEVTFQIAAI